MFSSHDQRTRHGWVMDGDQWVAKPCSGCGHTLPLKRFYKLGEKKIDSKCKVCRSEVTKARLMKKLITNP